MKSLPIYWLGLMVVILPLTTQAQFSKYWNESFSTKAALLAGAVVGGYQDETSIYYNPSILSDSSVNQFSFANGLVKLEGVRYEDALGQDQTIADWTTTVSPSFISVNFHPKDKFELVWKASIFNKSKYDRTIRTEYQEEGNFISTSPGNEAYVGKVNNRTEYDDYWYGIGAAKMVNSKFSMGFSLFARYSSLTYNTAQTIQLNGVNNFSPLNKVARNSNNMYLDGSTWRTTVKLGANYRVSEKLRVGLVVTSPSMRIIGTTRSERHTSNINIPNSTTGQIMPDNLYDATSDELPFTIKDPLSVALGLDFHRENIRVNVTGEFFGGVEPYKMVDQQKGETRVNMVPEVKEDPNFLSFVAGGKPVFNFAVGVELFQTNKKSFLFGFKTDFDALKDFDYQEYADFNRMVSAKSNYYHVSAGKSFTFLKYDVLFGVQYSFSRQKNMEAFANFSPYEIETSSDSYSLEGPVQHDMYFSGNTLTFFVGLTLKN